MSLISTFLFVAFGLLQGPSASAAAGVNARQQRLAELDSLYEARDTAGLKAAAKRWSGDAPPRVRFYRGIAAAWEWNPKVAIDQLAPVLDSSSSILDREERNEAIRALAESYGRTGRFNE